MHWRCCGFVLNHRYFLCAWWRHQMETFSVLLALCVRIRRSPVNSPHKGRSFNVFFDLRLNKRLNKQSWGWWFETPSRLLWRHHNGCAWLMSWPNSKFTGGGIYVIPIWRPCNEHSSGWHMMWRIHLHQCKNLHQACSSFFADAIDQSHKSHNVPVPYPTMHQMVTFLFWMVPYGMYGKCIVGFVNEVTEIPQTCPKQSNILLMMITWL